MKHQLPKFSVPMPGAKVEWPFGHELRTTDMRIVSCEKCGARHDLRDRSHVNAADTARPRKRICFG